MHRWLAGCSAVLVSSLVQSVGAQECVSNADCPDGYVCTSSDEGEGSPMPCIDPETCPEPEPTTVTGTCELGPLSCRSDGDCPSPLRCVTYEYSPPCARTDPNVPCESDVEVSQECVFVIADCRSDADCATGYECVPTSGGVTCTGSAPACAPGEECPPAEEECMVEPVANLCFPARSPCVTDADCPGDWTCLDFVATVGELPPWWEGVSDPRACMPPGLVAVFEGRADWEDGSGDSVTTERLASGAAESDSPAPDAARSGDDGGCAVAAGSVDRAGMLLALLLAGLGLGRRLRRA